MGSRMIDPVIETITQNGDPWSKSQPGCFTPVKKTQYLFNGRLGRPKVDLDYFEKKNISCNFHGTNPGSSSPYLRNHVNLIYNISSYFSVSRYIFRKSGHKVYLPLLWPKNASEKYLWGIQLHCKYLFPDFLFFSPNIQPLIAPTPATVSFLTYLLARNASCGSINVKCTQLFFSFPPFVGHI
jgi:hypothetical protein